SFHDLKSSIEEVSTRLEDLKSTIEAVSTHLKHLKSTIEQVSTHLKDLQSAIEEVSTHLNESNPSLKMSTPTEEVSREKEEVSTDLKSTTEEVSTHLKKSNYEDWITIVTELLERLCDFCDQHFPSTTQQREISEIEHQIDLYIEVLDSIPQGMDYPEEEKNSFNLIYRFEYLKGRFYNAIPDVYKKEAEHHLQNAVSERSITYLNLLNRSRYGWKLGIVSASAFPRKGIIMELENDIRSSLKWLYFAASSFLKIQPRTLKNASNMPKRHSLWIAWMEVVYVNRYLENYKMSLNGYSDAESMDPASDALHEKQVTIQLLDKFQGLLQGKRNDKNKGKSQGKSKRAYYMLCDSEENSFVLTVFNIKEKAIKQGDQVTLLDPICKFVDFGMGRKGKLVIISMHYQFKSVRVNLLEQVLVNGNPLCKKRRKASTKS
ncbi:hypothetical protein H5410_006032, partial [Solanum commersonii]